MQEPNYSQCKRDKNLQHTISLMTIVKHSSMSCLGVLGGRRVVFCLGRRPCLGSESRMSSRIKRTPMCRLTCDRSSTDQGDSTKLLLQPGLSLGPSIPPQVVSRSAPVCASEGLTQHQVFALDIVVNYSSEAGANTKLRFVANQIARARNG